MWYRILEINPSPGNNTNHEFIWCYNIICSSREVGRQRDKRTDTRAISRRVCNCNIEILPLGGSREPGKWFSSRLTCEPQSPMLGNIYWKYFYRDFKTLSEQQQNPFTPNFFQECGLRGGSSGESAWPTSLTSRVWFLEPQWKNLNSWNDLLTSIGA